MSLARRAIVRWRLGSVHSRGMKWISALLPLTLMVACKSNDGSDVPWRSLARSPLSGVAEPGLRVARSADEWRELWALHGRAMLKAPTTPELDLERDMAILVSDGQKPTAGWSLEVTALTIEDGQLIVQARVIAPPTDSMQAQVVTAPCEIIATTRHKLPVQLRITR